jgi:hypothetical protein
MLMPRESLRVRDRHKPIPNTNTNTVDVDPVGLGHFLRRFCSTPLGGAVGGAAVLLSSALCDASWSPRCVGRADPGAARRDSFDLGVRGWFVL